jgi:uncharacterized protein (DUF1684 family)
MIRRRLTYGSARLSLALLLVLSVIAACARKHPQSRIDPATYQKEIAQWQSQRLAELKSETGWLTLVGLFWLKEGENKFGSEPDNDILLPKDKLAGHAGSFSLHDGSVRLEATQEGLTIDGKSVKSLELKSDADDHPTILRQASLSFQIIKRGDKLGLRVKDSQNPDRLNFKGTEFYAPDVRWRIDARFEFYNPPKPMPIMNVLGMESSESSPGAVKFEVDGKEYRIDAITEKGERHLFMIVSDKTSGKDTYPAGGYLYVDPPDDRRIVIDFNKASSHPAHSQSLRRPLPPKQVVCLSQLKLVRNTETLVRYARRWRALFELKVLRSTPEACVPFVKL